VTLFQHDHQLFEDEHPRGLHSVQRGGRVLVSTMRVMSGMRDHLARITFCGFTRAVGGVRGGRPTFLTGVR
jgi:hypothetical protein